MDTISSTEKTSDQVGVASPDGEQQLTVIVRRRVKRGAEIEFESAMHEFIRFASHFPGHLGIHVLRPNLAANGEYTVVDRFVDKESRQAFTATAQYAEWMQRLKAYSDDDPHIQEYGGLSGWFTLPERPTEKPPTQVKMALVTFVGVYPLTSTLPKLCAQLLRSWSPLLVNVVGTGLIVVLLTWVIMPLLTRLFAPWLFPRFDGGDGASS